MNKVLVIGNQGYIGPILGRHLSSVNFEVIGYDIGFFQSCTLPGTIGQIDSVNCQFYKDVSDLTLEDFAGVYAVVYLAAISNDPMGEKFSDLTLDVNCNMAVKAACLAETAGVKKFIFASSCSVYGKGSSAPRKESDGLMPLTAYAKSKIEAETLLENKNFKSLTVTALRFATPCGVSPRLRLDLVLNDFVYSAIVNGKITVQSDGSPLRPLIDVEDMCKAIFWALSEKQLRNFEVFNCGADTHNFSIRDLAERASNLLSCNFEVNPNAKPDNRSYQVDFSKFQNANPNFTPKPIEKTITELKNAIKGNLETIKSSKNKYIRLMELEKQI